MSSTRFIPLHILDMRWKQSYVHCWTRRTHARKRGFRVVSWFHEILCTVYDVQFIPVQTFLYDLRRTGDRSMDTLSKHGAGANPHILFSRKNQLRRLCWCGLDMVLWYYLGEIYSQVYIMYLTVSLTFLSISKSYMPFRRFLPMYSTRVKHSVYGCSDAILSL